MFRNLGISMRLLRKSFGVLWNDKTLLAYPLTATGIIVLVLWLLYLSVNMDIKMFIFNMSSDIGELTVNWGWYYTLLLAYLALSCVATFFNAALVGAAHISMTERDSIYRDGIAAAFRKLPSLLIWSLLSSTFGLLISILDEFRTTSRLIHRLMGAVWGLYTFFVLPLIVLDRANVFMAIGRSGKVITETWGEALFNRLGLLFFLFVLNAPTLLLWVVTYTAWPAYLALVSFLTMACFFASLAIAQAAKSVLTVAMYLYATKGTPPEGWDADILADALLDRSDASESNVAS